MSEAKIRTENRMGTEPVHGLMLKMSLPLMASMLVMSMYNIVDSIFVSRVSEDALTAVSMCFPVQTLTIAFAIGTGGGMSALVSRYLGAKQFKKVNLVATNGMFLAWATSAVFVIIGFLSKYFIGFQTSDPEIYKYGTQYMSIICWMSITVFTQVMCERLMQGTGKTQLILFIQVAGAGINLILDPVFIFGLFGIPRLEVAGAAIATVIGQTCAAALGLYLNASKNKEIQISMKGFRPNWHAIKEIYRIGFPIIVMQSVGSLMVLLYNKILFSFTSTAVATFGAYFKIQSFIFMPVFGLNTGVTPIIAYNYGAKNRKRMEDAMSICARYGVGWMAIGTVLFWIFPEQILSLFDPSEEMMQIGVVALRVISVNFAFAGYSIMRGAVFQALGKSIYSMYISIVRQLGVLLPAAYFIAKLTNELNLVWLSFPIAEVAGLTLSIIFSRSIKRNIISKI